MIKADNNSVNDNDKISLYINITAKDAVVEDLLQENRYKEVKMSLTKDQFLILKNQVDKLEKIIEKNSKS